MHPAWLVAGIVAACTGPSVDPVRYAADLPAPVELDAEARRRAEEAGNRALDSATAGAGDDARAAAQEALAIDPRQARARAALGVLAMHEAQERSPPELTTWRRAEGDLLMAHGLAPRDPRVALALARFYVADGHGQAALAVLDEALVHAPREAELLRLASVVAYEAAEERSARSYLLRLIEQTPDDAASLYRLARCEAVLAERPRDEAARGQAWQQAAARFSRYAALVPGDVQGLLGEAQARFRLWQLDGETDPAERLAPVLDLYRAAAQLAPDLADPAFAEGVVREAQGDAAGAEAAYREALRRRPAHTPSLLNLAALLAVRGAEAEARTCWEKALATGLTPDERSKVTEILGR